MKTQITTVEQLKVVMFDFQVNKRWVGIEKLLRRALGKPDPGPGTAVQARVSGCLKKVLTVLINSFTMDEKGHFKTKGVFNDSGFRKCGYRMFGAWMSQRTISWAIRVLRDAGIITAYQDVNPDGTMGQWWVRLNPDVLIHWAEFKTGMAVILGSSPVAATCALSSSPNTEAFASQFPEKKKINTAPAVSDLSSKDLADFETLARQSIMATPVGKIVKKLEAHFPGQKQLTLKQLMQIERLAGDPVPQTRMDVQALEDLRYVMAECPDYLGNFENLEKVSDVIDYWKSIVKSIQQWRLTRHDNRIDDVKCSTQTIETILFDTRVTLQNLHGRSPDDEHTKINEVQGFVRGIMFNWPAKLMETYVASVSKFLVQRPMIYQMVVERFPQVRTMCDIPRSTHLRLLDEAKKLKAEGNVWMGIKNYYGFEC